MWYIYIGMTTKVVYRIEQRVRGFVLFCLYSHDKRDSAQQTLHLLFLLAYIQKSNERERWVFWLKFFFIYVQQSKERSRRRV